MSLFFSRLKGAFKVVLLAVAVAAVYFGIVLGEWSETMFNATLL